MWRGFRAAQASGVQPRAKSTEGTSIGMQLAFFSISLININHFIFQYILCLFIYLCI
jgi:hypothetical protein